MTAAAHPIVLVGTGAFASVHAAAVVRHPRLELRGVVGSTASAAREFAAAAGVRPYSDLDEALADGAVAGVILATPNATHAALAARALEAGLCVLVEKPVGVSAEEVRALARVEQRSTGRAMSGHLMRWAPAHRQARALLEEGIIGDIVAAESRRVLPWGAAQRSAWHLSAEEGGGMWLVQGVHVVDQLVWLVGRSPDRAVGIAATLFHRGQSADDFGAAMLDLGGVHGSITLAGMRQSVVGEVSTDVYGTAGILRVSHRGVLQVDTGDGWVDRLAPSAGDAWEATLAGELDEFARVIDGDQPETDLAYGERIVATVDAVRRSQISGRWEAVA